MVHRRLIQKFYENFRLETKQLQTKYAEIILDFSYFKISEAQDKKIEESSVGVDQHKNVLHMCQIPFHFV